MNAGRAFALGWRVFVALPGAVGRAIFFAVAVVVWAVRPAGVRQLEKNLSRLRPTASHREIRRLSFTGMRSYMRYYCEAFQLPSMTPAQIEARVRAVGSEPLRADFAQGRSVVLAVAHCGNWDLAGAWSCGSLAKVVTVAEKLEPEELFRAFLEFRESLGMTIIPFERGGGVFRTLLKHARSSAVAIPLLADRDLSQSGVQVDLAGHPARVASGPAALAVAAGVNLYPAHVRYERLHGPRRKAAGSPWGIVIEFLDPLAAPEGVPRERVVPELTQAWVSALGAAILAHPADWHMLQKVFVEDLDPARLPTPVGERGRPAGERGT